MTDPDHLQVIQALKELTVSGTVQWEKSAGDETQYALVITTLGPVVISIASSYPETANCRIDINMGGAVYRGYPGPEIDRLLKLIQTQTSFSEPDKHRQFEELAEDHKKTHPGLDVAQEVKRMKKVMLKAINKIP